MPRSVHPEYLALDRDSRIVVSKLAAILRVADALDRSHLQHVRALSFSREDGHFVITAADVDDVTLERVALKEKASLFEGVFGMPVILRTAQSLKGSLLNE